MAQHNWAYTGSSGKQYVVGLYHGAESGHLLVYCDLNVIHVDFNILQDWQYAFFIEDELLELSIKKAHNGQFRYDFEINQDIDTPRNRARKAHQKQERRLLRAFLVILAVMAALLAGAWWYNEVRVDERDLQTLAVGGWQTPAKVFFQTGDTELRYSFIVQGKIFESRVKMPVLTLLPLQPGDEFMVNYHYQKPHLHAIDFNDPSPWQEQQYRWRAFKRHCALHPEADSAYVQCLLQLAFELQGVAGYANFFYQNASSAENPAHNQQTYGRLVRDILFQNAVRARCR